MNANLISVLLVDDDPGDVLLVREAFEDNKVGNLLSVVSDGVEALQYVRGGCAPAGELAAVYTEHTRLGLAVGAEYGFS